MRSLDRINFRLTGDTFVAIQALFTARPGNVSRITWTTEAIEERSACEHNALTPRGGAHRAHG